MSETIGINVVFTDLVGSTEMSSRLGPDATEELRTIHFALLRGAMEAHSGREVKNLGDGLMIVFPSLASALDGAVAMQQAIDRHNSSGKEPLGIRVGISTGDATEEDDDFFGDPVVEAARLCAECEAGQIITSELISMLARRSDHTFEPIGDLELKGLPEPVAAVSVVWEPMQVQAVVALPERLKVDMRVADGGPMQIAGRASESEALAQAFKEAESGEHRITFLAGEPGIGKTRLCCELAAEAHGRGALVLYGRCDEELSVPYQPWVEAIGYLLDHSPPELVEEAIRLHGPELAQLVPQLRRQHPDLPEPQSSDPETERYMLLQAVTGCVALLAADSPVLLVLDDLHWADKPSLTLLRHLFTNLAASSLMIVGTYRDSDLGAGHPLTDTVAALRREPGVEQLSVHGLDDVEMVQLVEISAGHELDDKAREMALLLRQETAGNPFFAHEILRNLVESGDLHFDEATNRWVVEKTFEELTLPQSVRDVVGQRIARMGEDTLKVLSTAAVIGREFDLGLLAAVTGNDEDDLLDLLEEVVGAGILAEVPGGDERFRFLHTLARNTLSSDLSDGRRRRMHRKIAEALESSLGAKADDRAGELATHWLAAAVSLEEDKAIRYARLAGQQAQVALAPDEAVRWFTIAMENLDLVDDPDPALRSELSVELGIAQKHVGDPAYRQTLLDAGAAAAGLGNTPLMVIATLENSRGMMSKLGERDDERVAALEAALAAVGDEPTAERAALLANLVSEIEYSASFEERTELIDEAIGIARGLDDPATLSYVLNRFCVGFNVPHTLEARRTAAAESLAIAEELGDLTLQFWAGVGAFLSAAGAGAVDEFRAALDQLTAAADEAGRPSLKWMAGCFRCLPVVISGDGEALEVVGGETFAVGSDAGEPDAFDYYAISIMTARWLQGRGDELFDQISQAAADLPGVPAYAAVRGMFLAEQGDLEEAREELRAVAAGGFDLRVNNVWAISVGVWGMVAGYVNDAESARMLFDLLSPFSGQVPCGQSLTLSTMDSVLGRLATVLGDFDAAETYFRSAQELNRALDARAWEASDMLAMAAMHLARGESDDAAATATGALEYAKANNCGNVEKRATAFLESLASS